MKRVLLWGVPGLLALFVIAVLARNIIARVSVEVGARRITGFPLTIESVNVGLLNGQLDVAGLKLMNPQGFEERQFVDLKALHVDYRLGSMLALAPHINDMLVDIDQLVVVRNAKGESNAQKLRGVTSSDKPSTTRYRVDQLRIHVGTVTVKDYSRGRPVEKVMPLNITATYKDITDSTDITRLVLMTVMTQVRIPETNLRVDDLKKQLGDVEGLTGAVLLSATNTVDRTTKGLFDAVKKSIPQKQ